MIISARRKQLYVSMSYWSATTGMGNTTTAAGALNAADIGGSQDINVAAQPCGCVYYLQMDNTWNATTMAPLVCGTSQSADANGNTCAVNNIANPDNLNVMEDFDTLLISEDTSLHRVDYTWQARATWRIQHFEKARRELVHADGYNARFLCRSTLFPTPRALARPAMER